MPLETAEDRAAFLSLADDAVLVTVTPAAGGAAREFPALFDLESISIDLGDGVRSAGARAWLTGLEADLDGHAIGDAVAVSGRAESFRVAEPMAPDGSGFAQLPLKRNW